jgi:transcription elongation factor GreA
VEAKPTFVTREGYQELERLLDYLSTIRRREVSSRLRDARPDGGLLENAGLEVALAEQSFLEGRIAELRSCLASAIIIEEAGDPREAIGLGSRVTLIDPAGGGAPETYHIVGSIEADPLKGKISNVSPLGRALIGRRAGEEAVVDAPDGTILFKIVGVC